MSKVFLAFCLVFFFALPAFAQFVDIGWVARYNSTGNREDRIYAMNTDYDYATTSYFHGDANNDGQITVSDVVYLIDYLFKGGPAPVPIQSGDANCDGKVTIGDAVYLVNYLFKGGKPPDCSPTGSLVNHGNCKSFHNESTLDSVSADQDCIEYQYDGQRVLLLKHINSGFNCCPDDIIGKVTINNNVISIEEDEVLSTPCLCLCLFDLTLEIVNLDPGDYTISVTEPYVEPSEEKMEFPISLSSTPSSGIHCVKRLHYPWGVGR